jgi:predicted RNA binding protein YcfA (HicA-like mRNA interferase family)
VELVGNQGWRYSRHHGRHPVLYPADRTAAPVTVPTTPGDNRAFKNWVSEVRRKGGIWPPPRKGK